MHVMICRDKSVLIWKCSDSAVSNYKNHLFSISFLGHDSLRFDSLDGANDERYVHTPRGVGLRQQSDLADESWTNEGVQISVVFGLIQSQQVRIPQLFVSFLIHLGSLKNDM